MQTQRRESADRPKRASGRHVVWTEEPDIFCVRLSGAVSRQELQQIIDWRVAFGRGRRAYYVLCDLESVGNVSPAARRLLSEATSTDGVRVHSVCHGASFGVRVLLDMVSRALRTLQPEVAEAEGELVFTASEAEARAEIDRHRTSGARNLHAH